MQVKDAEEWLRSTPSCPDRAPAARSPRPTRCDRRVPHGTWADTVLLAGRLPPCLGLAREPRDFSLLGELG